MDSGGLQVIPLDALPAMPPVTKRALHIKEYGALQTDMSSERMRLACNRRKAFLRVIR